MARKKELPLNVPRLFLTVDDSVPEGKVELSVVKSNLRERAHPENGEKVFLKALKLGSREQTALGLPLFKWASELGGAHGKVDDVLLNEAFEMLDKNAESLKARRKQLDEELNFLDEVRVAIVEKFGEPCWGCGKFGCAGSCEGARFPNGKCEKCGTPNDVEKDGADADGNRGRTLVYCPKCEANSE